MHTSYDMTFFPFIYERIKFLFPFAMTIFFSLGTYRIIFSGIKKNVDTDFKTIFFWFHSLKENLVTFSLLLFSY